MISSTATGTIQLPDIIRDVRHDGFSIVSNAIEESTIELLLNDLRSLSGADAVRKRGEVPFGIRNVDRLVPSTRRLTASDPVVAISRALAGENATLVRSLFFDKIAAANWRVGWHQDCTIAVRRRIEAVGFGPWTVKAGVPHVQPPDSVLEKMIALRIHLDDAGEHNGALKVIPGSHREGRLAQVRIEELKEGPRVTCVASKGSILVMRPLLLHSSSPCTEPSHRRVIHLEFAGFPLPGGLEWDEC